MSIIVTGGAGFIGSCMVRKLNDMGHDDIIIVDNVQKSEKWNNLRGKRYIRYINKEEFDPERIEERVTCIIHMGACSSTTETDFDYLYKNNYEFSQRLWRYAERNGCQFIYASSAATYGDGEMGFDDRSDIRTLDPLNRYGYSKQIFDLWADGEIKAGRAPIQHVGLKFFNVFGPNEYHKGSMASMVYHGYKQIKADGEVRLFKSCNANYEDGKQLRDFVYVKDVCSIIAWFMRNEECSGLFNVGTGTAHSFCELIEATFSALGLPANIRYIDMPAELRGKYQYYTQATMDKLRSVGCDVPFTPLDEAVRDYVCNHLDRDLARY